MGRDRGKEDVVMEGEGRGRDCDGDCNRGFWET